MKRLVVGVALVGCLIAGALLVWLHIGSALPTVTIDGSVLHVAIADTQATQEKGLGGRTGLAPDEGMLFVFPRDGQYAFWMKDMQFPIDITWIAADHTIIYMAQNVSPDTYPHTFAPDANARYVLETASGYMSAHHVKKGDLVRF
jgi:uncharacterized membrane protein (UPF0127 family)